MGFQLFRHAREGHAIFANLRNEVLARIERQLAVAQSDLERAIRDSEQLLNLLEVPQGPLRMPF